MSRGEREERRLLAMLREAGAPIPRGSSLRRVYTSPPQRNAGAWAWQVIGPDGRWLNVGSQWRRRELLSKGVVVTPVTLHGQTDWHVDPVQAVQP